MKQQMRPVDITCPVCRLTWSIETPRSWWRWSDRCWGCMEPLAGDPTDG